MQYKSSVVEGVFVTDAVPIAGVEDVSGGGASIDGPTLSANLIFEGVAWGMFDRLSSYEFDIVNTDWNLFAMRLT